MFQRIAAPSLDYDLCHYGPSRLRFRGPARQVSPDAVVVLGGSDSFGRFVDQPFPDLLQGHLDRPVINLGTLNGGIDAVCHDLHLQDLANQAGCIVVQATAASHMSNRLYKVHPRHNDRFLGASALLRSIYAEVDFTEFHYVRHMLTTLSVVDPRKFGLILHELRAAWMARMRRLIGGFERPVILLWAPNGSPLHHLERDEAQMDHAPLFVDAEMVGYLSDVAAQTVTVAPSPGALKRGTEGMIFAPWEGAAAAQSMTPAVHEEVATALCDPVRDMFSR